MKRQGFTLIELLIVISVIAILIGITLPRFKGLQEEGNISKSKGEMNTLKTAVESYYIHNKAYPAGLANLTTAKPQIIAAVPNDPFSGAAYGYAVSPNGSYYVVYSTGLDNNGSATVADTGIVTETNGTSCIYATNGIPLDTTP
jgi:general secretion pathway protein G